MLKPASDKVISSRIDDHLKDNIRRIADTERRSIAGAVNSLLVEALTARGILPNERSHEVA